MRIGAISYPFGVRESDGARPDRTHGRRGPSLDGRAGRAEGAEHAGGGDTSRGQGEGRGVELSPELDEATRQVVREMAARDREVRAHEAAHAAVGGRHAGSPSYTYESGPDGRRYAVAGEVPISLPTGGPPKDRIAAARQVRAAALAPAQPSSADQAVAAAASKIEAEARAELAQETMKAKQGEEGPRADQRTERASAGLQGERAERSERRGASGRAQPAESAEPRADIRRAYHQHADGGASCPHCRAGSAGSMIGG